MNGIEKKEYYAFMIEKLTTEAGKEFIHITLQGSVPMIEGFHIEKGNPVGTGSFFSKLSSILGFKIGVIDNPSQNI